MAHLTLKELEVALCNPVHMPYGYVYVETGKYKPYMESTVRAAKARGYRVEKKVRGVYYIYPKAE